MSGSTMEKREIKVPTKKSSRSLKVRVGFIAQLYIKFQKKGTHKQRGIMTLGGEKLNNLIISTP
jgi:hypothetical protein